MFDVKEQRLVDWNWQIVAKKWFSDLASNDINGKSMGVNKGLMEMLVKFLLRLVKKTMFCVKMRVMSCWRNLSKSRSV